MAYLQHISVLDQNHPTRGGGDGNEYCRSRSDHGDLLFARQAEYCQKEFAVSQRVVLVGFVAGGNGNVDGRARG